MLSRATTAPNIDLFTDSWRRCLATITIHELLVCCHAVRSTAILATAWLLVC